MYENCLTPSCSQRFVLLFTHAYMHPIYNVGLNVTEVAYQTGKTTEAREDLAGDSKRIRARCSNTEYFVTLCLLQPPFCVSL